MNEHGDLTIYGRHPVLEALKDPAVVTLRVHLARENKRSPILDEIRECAEAASVEVYMVARQKLSRISRNGKQDQGVAADLHCPHFDRLDEWLRAPVPDDCELMAVDGVTNGQNLGMIVRSVAASPMAGLIVPDAGSARLDSLVIKASAGTLFGATVLSCTRLGEAIAMLKASGFCIIGLDGGGSVDLAHCKPVGPTLFVLGNESTGLADDTRRQCDQLVRIPLAGGVESLNVAVAAGIVAMRRVVSGR
jgi:23S rRNA (guanosine2251-2'-O)-methyltransferase